MFSTRAQATSPLSSARWFPIEHPVINSLLLPFSLLRPHASYYPQLLLFL